MAFPKPGLDTLDLSPETGPADTKTTTTEEHHTR